MSIKTRKIQIIPLKEDVKDVKKYKVDYLKKLSQELCIVGNDVIRKHLMNQINLLDIKNNNNITKSEATKILEGELGTSIRNYGYRAMSENINIPSSIRSCFNSVIYKTIDKNFFDILKSKISVPSFTKGNITIPISTTSGDGIINKLEEKYIISLPKGKDYEYSDFKMELMFGKDKSNNKSIVDKAISGIYKICDSSIKIDENKGNIYLLLVVDIPTETNKYLDPSKVMGIDVGINRPVSIYITNEKYQPKQIDIGAKMQHDRIRMSKERYKLSSALKYTNGGHGRKRKLQKLNEFRCREQNWATNINHKISKEIVNTCLRFNVGTINMEDLTGITTNIDDMFLKTWKYYQLQSFIEYKAKINGILVKWVDPKNTSITCPYCLEVNKENRNENDKTIFKCKNTWCEKHDVVLDADVVAAENISKLIGSDDKIKSKKGRLKAAKNKKENILTKVEFVINR